MPDDDSTLRPTDLSRTPSNNSQEYDIVVFSDNDPEDPTTWSNLRKSGILAMSSLLAFAAVFGSSSYVSLSSYPNITTY